MHIDWIIEPEDLPPDCIAECSHSGDCQPEVDFWRHKLDLTVNRERAIICLRGFGAWDDDELEAMSDERLAETILWLACGTFKDGGDLFALE